VYEKIEILDNSTIDNIENNLRKYELSILIRSKDDKGNKDTERLEKERDVLKNHLQKLSMGQLDINNRRNDAG
jgi:predicted nucleotide-binding protein